MTKIKKMPFNLLRPFRPCSEGAEWLRPYQSKQKAWEECPNLSWMLWYLERCDVGIEVFGSLACDFADLVLPFATDNVPKRTIEIIRKFLRGEATKEELDKARAAAWATAEEAAAQAAGAANRAAWARAAWAATGAAAWVAARDAEVATKAAAGAAARAAEEATKAAAEKQAAAIVRKYFPQPPELRRKRGRDRHYKRRVV